MKVLDYSVFVAAAPAQVFRVIADPRSKLAWVPSIRRVEMELDSPLGAGIRYLTAAGIGPFEFVFHERIVTWIENQQLVYEGYSSWGCFETTAVFQPSGNGTILHHRMCYTFSMDLRGQIVGMLGRLAGIFVLRPLEIRIKRRLKEVIERDIESWQASA